MSKDDKKDDCGVSSKFKASSSDAYSRLVEAYCSEIGRERVRPYLRPFQSSSKGIPIITFNNEIDSSVSYKNVDNDTDIVSSVRNEKDFPALTYENDIDENENQDHSSYKNVSPSSSITSRKLEWDSLADIGYANVDQNIDSHNKGLSTLERIALNPHRRSVSSMDKRGEKAKYVKYPGLPVAQSTPNSPTERKSSPTASSASKPFVVSHKRKTFRTKKKYVNKFNLKSDLSYKVQVNIAKSLKTLNPSNLQPKSLNDHSDTDYITINSSKSESHIENTSRTTHSAFSCDQKSRSATPASDEVIESPEQYHISTPLDSKSSERESVSLKFDSSKLSSQKSETSSTKSEKSVLNFGNTDTSVPVSVSNDNIDLDNSILSKVNSFEFVPGDVYNEQKKENSNSHSLLALQILKEHSPPPLISKNKSTEESDIELINSIERNLKSLTFPRDYRNLKKVESVKELIELKYTNPIVKEKLMKKIIQLVASEHKFDNNSPSSNESNNDNKEKKSSKSIIDNETQTDNNLKKFEICKQTTPEIINIESSMVNIEESNNKPEIAHNFCQTSKNSSSSHSSTYEEYLKEKNRELLLKKAHIVRKMSNLELKKSSLNSEALDRSAETERKLKKINNEILKLLILKFKLENKYETKNFDSILKVFFNESPKNKTYSDISESKNINSMTLESDSRMFPSLGNNVNVPPLNLKMTSDELSEDIEKSFRKSGKEEKCEFSDRSDKVKSESLHSKSCLLKKSLESCDCKMDSYAKSCSSCDVCDLKSNSNFSDSSELIEYKINRLREKYSKYRKCHIMKSFLNDYNLLINKYTKMKISPTEKRTEEHSNQSNNSISKPRVSLENTVSKNTATVEKNITEPIEIQSTHSIIASENYEIENVSDKSKSCSDSISESGIKKESPQTSSNVQNPVKVKHDISNSIAKEIFNMMEKIEKKLNEDSQNRKKEAFKVDASVQISSSSLNSSLSFSKQSQDNKKISEIQSIQGKSTSNNKIAQLKESNLDTESQKAKKSENLNELCLKCLKNSKNEQTNICTNCLREYRRKSNRVFPKPVAYNLVLEPGNSILVDSDQNKNKRILDEIVVRVPKISFRNKDQALHQIKERAVAVTQSYFESLGSTDDQLKDFSSLKDDNLSDRVNITIEDITSASSHQMSNDKENMIPDIYEGHTRKNMLTVKDYLKMNRPKFVSDADKRRECLKNNHLMRLKCENQKRELIEHNLSDFVKLKNHSTYLQSLKCGKQTIPENQRLFNAKEIVKKTALRYKKLPEVKRQKDLLKKQRQLKTNRLIANIFIKKLQQRTLKGMVNISHSSNVVSL